MSTAGDTQDRRPPEEQPAQVGGEQPHRGGHPTPRQYVNIALVLAVITAAEVAASYVALPEWLFTWSLVVMAAAKFAIVVGFYMHLKFDSLMFRRVFVFGIGLAATVFFLVFAIFVFVQPQGARVAA